MIVILPATLISHNSLEWARWFCSQFSMDRKVVTFWNIAICTLFFSLKSKCSQDVSHTKSWPPFSKATYLVCLNLRFLCCAYPRGPEGKATQLAWYKQLTFRHFFRFCLFISATLVVLDIHWYSSFGTLFCLLCWSSAMENERCELPWVMCILLWCFVQRERRTLWSRVACLSYTCLHCRRSSLLSS